MRNENAIVLLESIVPPNNLFLASKTKEFYDARDKGIEALKKRIPQPVIEESDLTPYCPICESASWMTNEDGEPNDYCGRCGQRLDWKHPEHPDAEEAEEEES